MKVKETSELNKTERKKIKKKRKEGKIREIDLLRNERMKEGRK